MAEKLKYRFRWLVSSHYKIERFGVLMLAFSLSMAILMGSIVKHKMDMDKETLGSNVVYTTEFGMSLSNSRARVVNIFSNSAQTKCFILLYFPDMTKVVTDAGQYQIFLTGSDMRGQQQTPLCNPTATIYMFGVTGYMGIYLVDTAGFQSQILDLVLRCNILTGSMPTQVPTYEDASFNKFDQGRMYFNPGASGYIVADFLDNPKMSVSDIYNYVVVQSQEEAIRQRLSAGLENMRSALSRIEEYKRRVTDSGVIVPVEPIQIRDDRVEQLEDGRLELRTNYVMQGGYSFNWFNGTIRSGYLAGVVPGGTTPARYIASQRRSQSGERMDLNDLRWLRSDGTDFYAEEDVVKSAAYKQADANISNLKSAWSNYYALKKQYQVDDMEALLLLEMDAGDISTNYTVNATDNVTVYG